MSPKVGNASPGGREDPGEGESSTGRFATNAAKAEGSGQSQNFRGERRSLRGVRTKHSFRAIVGKNLSLRIKAPEGRGGGDYRKVGGGGRQGDLSRKI